MKTHAALLATLFLSIGTLVSTAGNTVTVNAADLIGKVYGVADPACSEESCRKAVAESIGIATVSDEDAEWLSSDNGFRLAYEGQTPEVEAMARYDRGEVAGYGYIFYFPYSAHERESANNEQCEFCGALLQELSDMGLVLGSDTMTDALFDVNGAYEGGDVQLILREEIASQTIDDNLPAGAIPADRQGQFTLVISVVPANATGFTAQN